MTKYLVEESGEFRSVKKVSLMEINAFSWLLRHNLYHSLWMSYLPG